MIKKVATYQKYCQCCRTNKSAIDFDRSYRSADGLKTHCIECHKAKSKAKAKEDKSKPNNSVPKERDKSFDYIDRIGVLRLGMSIDDLQFNNCFKHCFTHRNCEYMEIENLKLFDEIEDAEFIKNNISTSERYMLGSATLIFYEEKLIRVVTEYCSIIATYLKEEYGNRIEYDGDDYVYIYYGANCWVSADLNDGSYIGIELEDSDIVELLDEY